MFLRKIINQLFINQPPTKKDQVMTTATIERIQETTKIILPKTGVFKGKYGNSVWDYLPYEYSFKNKEEYFIWKKLWKNTYKELSQEIRKLKDERNLAYHMSEIDKGGQAACKAVSKKAEAREYLKIYKEGKTLSWQQKLKNQEFQTI